ncbi:MAG: hypothetical protein LUF02_01515 [Erysipelotrichaceae bacterium]|nr:hypothetical protein [Erysipelotrichaceae bacterium]
MPVVLNPYFFIPMIISHTVTSIVTYEAFALGLVTKAYIITPWCLPAPILAIVQSGMDIRACLIPIINFIIGVIIFYPFFKSYEKQETEKIASEEETK